MPLIRIDALAGRSPEQIKTLLDAAHRAILSAFKVPERDRYQVYQEHPEATSSCKTPGSGFSGRRTLSSSPSPADRAAKR